MNNNIETNKEEKQEQEETLDMLLHIHCRPNNHVWTDGGSTCYCGQMSFVPRKKGK